MDARAAIELEEHFFNGPDGLRLFFRRWGIPRPRRLVCLVHGFAEHCGRYDHVAERLCDAGYAVAAVDLRGHGQSGGKRAHIDSFDEYLVDLGAFLDEARRVGLPDRPVLLGHSQGGLIAARYAELHADELSALVLTSPFLGFAMEVPAVKAAVGRLVSRVWPSFSMPSGLDPAWLSHDREVVERYAADPMVSHHVTTRWFTEVNAAQALTLAEAGKLDLPLLVLQAGDDRLSSPAATQRLFAGAGSHDKQMETYAGYFHEVLNEVGRAKVLDDLVAWLGRRPG